MRILHVIQELAVGGAERVVVALVNGAQAEGHQVAIAAAQGPIAKEVSVPIYPLPLVVRQPSRIPALVAAVARAVGRQRPDIVHVHNPKVALATGIATLRGRRVPGVVTVQGVPEADYPAAARALRFAGFPVVPCGPDVADALARRGLVLLATIPNAVPAPPPPADAAATRREFGLRTDQPLVLSVGRLVSQKNHALAISALARIPDTALAILGAGPLGEELRAHATAEGVGDRVVFAGVRDDAWALMGAANAVVLSSDWEGLPLTALEALAIGAPLVSTEVRGVKGVLENESTALLVPPGDAGALAVAIQRVVNDEALAERIASAGQLLAARFDEKTMTAAYLRLYELVADRRV
jgi:glycosyltransferase involved in cell wall biosynthesis